MNFPVFTRSSPIHDPGFLRLRGVRACLETVALLLCVAAQPAHATGPRYAPASGAYARSVATTLEGSVFVIASAGDFSGSAHYSCNSLLGEVAPGDVSSSSYSNGSGFWSAATSDSARLLDAPVIPGSAELLVETMSLTSDPSRGLGIRFVLRSAGQVSVQVYDVTGRSLARLREAYPAGEHTLYWNRSTDSQRPAPAGVYFVRVETQHMTYSAKGVLIR